MRIADLSLPMRPHFRWAASSEQRSGDGSPVRAVALVD
jgi:hypothetical protein